MGNCAKRPKRSEQSAAATAAAARHAYLAFWREELIAIPSRRYQVYQGGEPFVLEEHDLTRQILKHALSLMAEYIHREGQAVTVIIVGGTLNVMHLRDRQSTHDVDFLGTNISKAKRLLLEKAAEYAERESPTPLGGLWFNNEVELMLIDVDVHHMITREAIAQNEVVFERTGLKVIAAPWKYAFCSKISRLAGRRSGGAQPHDLPDAASYLHRYIQKHGGRPISERTFKRWATAYHQNQNPAILRQVAAEYRRLYREDGIEWSTRGAVR